MGNDGRFKPGWKGGPGRSPIILPEVRRAIDANRNAVRVLILQKLEPHLEEWLDSIIAKGVEHGDTVRFKTLVEIALGNMVEDPEKTLTTEERAVLEAYRRRRAELGPRSSGEDSQEGDSEGGTQ